MLEKSGALLVTSEELETMQRGEVPVRLFLEWGLQKQDLPAIMAEHQYAVVDSDSDKV